MISPDYCRTMARYNAWQNRSLYDAASRLSDPQRRADRGLFFRSIHGTLGHLLWADMIWMGRFEEGWDLPPVGPGEGESWMGWTDLCEARAEADARIRDWAGRLTQEALEGELAWHSAVTGQEMRRTRWLLLAHFFNHQTHHRGQVHAALTGFGQRTGITDLGFMDDADGTAT